MQLRIREFVALTCKNNICSEHFRNLSTLLSGSQSALCICRLSCRVHMRIQWIRRGSLGKKPQEIAAQRYALRFRFIIFGGSFSGSRISGFGMPGWSGSPGSFGS